MPSAAASNRIPQCARILLVDDNGQGMLARRSVLEELGYTIVSAGCGADALVAVTQNTFDLVITDYKMEPMNGLELIVNLRGMRFSKPIILLTGFAEKLGLNPENTGADVVIQKSSNEITNLVRHTQRLLQGLAKKPPRSIRGKVKATQAGETS